LLVLIAETIIYKLKWLEVQAKVLLRQKAVLESAIEAPSFSPTRLQLSIIFAGSSGLPISLMPASIATRLLTPHLPPTSLLLITQIAFGFLLNTTACSI